MLISREGKGEKFRSGNYKMVRLNPFALKDYLSFDLSDHLWVSLYLKLIFCGYLEHRVEYVVYIQNMIFLALPHNLLQWIYAYSFSG